MWAGTDEARSIATIRSAVERGVTLIDRRPSAPKRSSARLSPRAACAIKCGSRRSSASAGKDGQPFRDSRPARIRREIEASLRLLRTDVIDLYQVHWPDLPIAETARTLDDLRRQAKSARSASTTIRLHRWTPSARGHARRRCEARRPTVLTTARCVGGSSRGKSAQRRGSKATICARRIRSFRPRGPAELRWSAAF
jgi:aryl-alcohol dehydrogenase-like predicted oxidoreductase